MRKLATFLALGAVLGLYTGTGHAECNDACVRAYTQYLINMRIKLELEMHENVVARAVAEAELVDVKRKLTEAESKLKQADQPKGAK